MHRVVILHRDEPMIMVPIRPLPHILGVNIVNEELVAFPNHRLFLE